jgi:hypothetical protein
MGTLEFIKPLVQRYRSWFKLFWLFADAAFANPENTSIAKKNGSHILSGCQAMPARSASWDLSSVVRSADPQKSGIQVKIVDL